jgi:hypothetical protein
MFSRLCVYDIKNFVITREEAAGTRNRVASRAREGGEAQI